MVAHQGVAPGGKLHPYLVAAAGFQKDPYKAFFPRTEQPIAQLCGPDPGPGTLDHKDLILPAVLKKQIAPPCSKLIASSAPSDSNASFMS